MVREVHWRASFPADDRRPTWETAVRWWACSAPNRLADRAGGYRRIAIGLAALPIPLVIMGGALLADGGPASGAMAHVVAALGCGWLACNLVQCGSSLNRRARPHASSVGLLTAIGLLIGLAPVEPTAGFGPPVLLVVGMAGLVAGYVVLMAAERRGNDRFLFMAGRWSIVAGAILVGAMQLGQTVIGFAVAPLYATGLGTVATLLLVMAWSEARVLRRGAALLRALARR